MPWFNFNGTVDSVNYINVIAGAAAAPSSPVLELGVDVESNGAQIVPLSAAGSFGPKYAITLGPYLSRVSSVGGLASVSLTAMLASVAATVMLG